MRQRPNPALNLWDKGPRADDWIVAPAGAFTPPPPPPTVVFEYSDGVDILYSDSTAVYYV